MTIKVVAFGGGHGLSASLRALRCARGLDLDITAVVTVADDGGSSGRLRAQRNALPPGDLRQALAALAGSDPFHQLTADLFQHRFLPKNGAAGESGDGGCPPITDPGIELPDDPLTGHAVGNLVLCGLMEMLGDPVAALDHTARMLGAVGRVLPMCCEPLDIEADVIGLDEDPTAVRRIRGQVAVATTPGRVQRVRLHRADDPRSRPRACPQAVQAVLDADVVLLGPGSWFTSVLPHLLVPELHEALVATPARRLVILNLEPQPGETAGFSPEQHLHVLAEHAPRLRIDTVVADVDAVPTPDRLRRAAAELGAHTVFGRVSTPGVSDRHDPRALASSLREALGFLDQERPGRALEESGALQGTVEREEGTPWR